MQLYKGFDNINDNDNVDDDDDENITALTLVSIFKYTQRRSEGI